MKCQHCEQREATVHLLESDAPGLRDLWLCAECAEAEQWRRLDSLGSLEGPPESAEVEGVGTGAFDSMLKFLGQDSRASGRDGVPECCPHCGLTLIDFQARGHVGCARCYQAFHGPMLPLLSAFHRHVTHMGLTPGARSGGGTRAIEISRLRVDLEKAIAREEFEEAARLRDQLRTLEKRDEKGEGRD